MLFQSTPRVNGATGRLVYIPSKTLISIHAPRERGDQLYIFSFYSIIRFQSTPRVNGATPTNTLQRCPTLFQSTPRVNGATRSGFTSTDMFNPFQSTPRVNGATALSLGLIPAFFTFQSTPPRERGDFRHRSFKRFQDISIHAPRERGDGYTPPIIRSGQYFNPRPA